MIIRRQLYIRSLQKRGWTFESKPALESGFRIEGSVMGFSVDKHDTELIGFGPTSHISLESRVVVRLEEPADRTARCRAE